MAKRKIDFSGVETYLKAPEGTHAAKVVEVEDVTFQSGNEGLKVVYEITQGIGKGARIYDNFSFADNALWKLKTLLEALKIKCNGRILLDTDKMVGKTLEIEVIHEEYEGKTRAKVTEMRKLSASKAEDEDEDIDDADEDDDIDVDDIDDDDAVEVDDVEEEEEKKPAEKAPAKKAAKKPAKKAVKKEEPEDEDDDDFEDDFDDDDDKEAKTEEKKSKKIVKSKAKKVEKKKEEPKKEESDDDDFEDDDDDEWEDA